MSELVGADTGTGDVVITLLTIALVLVVIYGSLLAVADAISFYFVD